MCLISSLRISEHAFDLSRPYLSLQESFKFGTVLQTVLPVHSLIRASTTNKEMLQLPARRRHRQSPFKSQTVRSQTSARCCSPTLPFLRVLGRWSGCIVCLTSFFGHLPLLGGQCRVPSVSKRQSGWSMSMPGAAGAHDRSREHEVGCTTTRPPRALSFTYCASISTSTVSQPARVGCALAQLNTQLCKLSATPSHKQAGHMPDEGG